MVLEFYRARWQVELAFKRLKSLLQMGQLPKKKEASCRAWMQGKTLTALLIERLLCEARWMRSCASGIDGGRFARQAARQTNLSRFRVPGRTLWSARSNANAI